MGIGKYLKKAFLYHWNLLAFLGGLGFAAVSGHADIIAPLVLAGEVAYLGLLGTNPKFQKYVEAQEHQAERQEGTVSPELAVRNLLNALPESLSRRFESLRSRCLELRQLAQQLHDPHRSAQPLALEDLHLEGLDRLLWIYLRMLFTYHSLERFLQKSDDEEIRRDVQDLEARLNALPRDDDPQRQRIRKSLEDNLATSRARLENARKARDNYELIRLEIDRLENKIRSVSEQAINRQDTNFISGQVDEVVRSMHQTERTMSELQLTTGLQTPADSVPQLLRRETVQTRQ